MFLLDTNVLSQRPKRHPNAAVMAWLQRTDSRLLRISAISIQEIRFGIELKQPGSKRRMEIEQWLQRDILPGWAERILPVDVAVAEACGRLLAAAKKRHYTPSPNDALIAATAIAHHLKVATLNVKDFEPLGVELASFDLR